MPSHRTTDISVIIPCFNGEAYLTRAIDSVLGQNAQPESITVVNDGSTDNSRRVAEPYGDRIRWIDLPRNSGSSAARNAGVAASAGTWIVCLDADDELLPGALRDFATATADTTARVIFGDVDCCDESSGTWRTQSASRCLGPPPTAARENLWGSAISTPGAAMVHRSLHDEIGGYSKPWQPTEDRDYWLKCGVLTAFQGTNTTVLRKYRRSNSMVRTFSDKAVYWGLRVQIEFVDWCRERGIDTDFIPHSPTDFAMAALTRATDVRDWRVASLILGYAEQRHIPVEGARTWLPRLMRRALRLGDHLTGPPLRGDT